MERAVTLYKPYVIFGIQNRKAEAAFDRFSHKFYADKIKYLIVLKKLNRNITVGFYLDFSQAVSISQIHIVYQYAVVR